MPFDDARLYAHPMIKSIRKKPNELTSVVIGGRCRDRIRRHCDNIGLRSILFELPLNEFPHGPDSIPKDIIYTPKEREIVVVTEGDAHKIKI